MIKITLFTCVALTVAIWSIYIAYNFVLNTGLTTKDFLRFMMFKDMDESEHFMPIFSWSVLIALYYTVSLMSLGRYMG